MVRIFGYTVAVAIQRCRIPAEFVLEQLLCHLDEAKTRFAVVVKARARKKFLTVRNLRPRQTELQAPPFVGLEWDGQPEIIQYSRVFAEQVSHELRLDVDTPTLIIMGKCSLI